MGLTTSSVRACTPALPALLAASGNRLPTQGGAARVASSLRAAHTGAVTASALETQEAYGAYERVRHHQLSVLQAAVWSSHVGQVAVEPAQEAVGGRVNGTGAWKAVSQSLRTPLTDSTRQQLQRMSDLRSPHLWYPDARRMRRRIVLHVGPTNSGKTHAALGALQQARNGMYCGPLRLLAWEIHERLNDAGTPCDLITGQERECTPTSRHVSCTVEMADVSRPLEVVVLDEIQMIGDEDRGWAWTRVLLGAAAQEIHCCGDPASVPLLTAITSLTGDELVIREYQRLSPLTVAEKPLAGLEELRRGDVVVAFSRRKLYEWKRKIETRTGLRVGLIYGALPPAVRRDQAKRFNARSVAEMEGIQEDEVLQDTATDILCASDAVGMGLNLSIGRVVFTACDKFDGTSVRDLTVSELKQIGGRAGRYGSLYPQGTVVTLNRSQLGKVRSALGRATPFTPCASLQPTLEHVEAFAACLAPHVLHGEAARELLGAAGVVNSDSDSDWQDEDEEEEEEEEEYSSSSGSDSSETSDVEGSTSSDGEGEGEGTGSDSDDAEAWSSGSGLPSLPFPPSHISLLADAVAETVPFSTILDLFATCARTDNEKGQGRQAGGRVQYGMEHNELPAAPSTPRFILATSLRGSLLEAARLVDDIPLPFRARFAFCQAPIDTEDALLVQALRRYATKFVEKGRVRVGLKLPSSPPSTPWELSELESAHAVFDLYTWLARKFPAEFIQLQAAQEGAAATQLLITEGLERMGEDAVRVGRQRAASDAARRAATIARAEAKAARQAAEGGDKRGKRRKRYADYEDIDRERELFASDYLLSMLPTDVDEEDMMEGEGYGVGGMPRARAGKGKGREGRARRMDASEQQTGFMRAWSADVLQGEEEDGPRIPRPSKRKQREERKVERKADRRKARAQRKMAESMIYAAAAKGTLDSLSSDPSWQSIMSSIQSRGDRKRKGKQSDGSQGNTTRRAAYAQEAMPRRAQAVLNAPLDQVVVDKHDVGPVPSQKDQRRGKKAHSSTPGP